MNMNRVSITLLLTALVTLGIGACASQPLATTKHTAAVEVGTSYIVLAESVEAAEKAVRETGGLVTHSLPTAGAVSAQLTWEQRQALERNEAVRRLYEDV